jgi:hypothetical protein
LNGETLTNVFWGLFLIWFGVATAIQGGNFGATLESPLFAVGTGVLLLLLNLVRASMRLRVSPITSGLGALLALVYAPLYFLNVSVPFLPLLLVVAGIALVIGAIRAGRYYLV